MQECASSHAQRWEYIPPAFLGYFILAANIFIWGPASTKRNTQYLAYHAPTCHNAEWHDTDLSFSYIVIEAESIIVFDIIYYSLLFNCRLLFWLLIYRSRHIHALKDISIWRKGRLSLDLERYWAAIVAPNDILATPRPFFWPIR